MIPHHIRRFRLSSEGWALYKGQRHWWSFLEFWPSPLLIRGEWEGGSKNGWIGQNNTFFASVCCTIPTFGIMLRFHIVKKKSVRRGEKNIKCNSNKSKWTKSTSQVNNITILKWEENLTWGNFWTQYLNYTPYSQREKKLTTFKPTLNSS